MPHNIEKNRTHEARSEIVDRCRRTAIRRLHTRIQAYCVVLSSMIALTNSGCGVSDWFALRSCPTALPPAPIEDDPLPPQFLTRSIPNAPDGGGPFPYNHTASIVELPNGDLLVAWGAGTHELAPDTRIVVSRLPGDSWSAPIVLTDKPDFADANCVLFVDDAGVVHLYYVEMFGDSFCLGRTMQMESADYGESWSQPRPLLDAFCILLRGRPIITAGGAWILPAYEQAVYQSQFWRSTDRGVTWQASGKLFSVPLNLQPAVAQLADGALFALMRNGSSTGTMLDARGDACGIGWTVRERDDLPNPNSGIELIRLRTGELLAIYNDSAIQRTPLVAALSTDSGESWSSPKIIADGPPQLSYPSAIQSTDGRIHVVYSANLTHIEHVTLTRAWLLQP